MDPSNFSLYSQWKLELNKEENVPRANPFVNDICKLIFIRFALNSSRHVRTLCLWNDGSGNHYLLREKTSADSARAGGGDGAPRGELD